MTKEQLQEHRPEISYQLGSAMAVVKFASEFQDQTVRRAILERLSPDHVELYNCFYEANGGK